MKSNQEQRTMFGGDGNKMEEDKDKDIHDVRDGYWAEEGDEEGMRSLEDKGGKTFVGDDSCNTVYRVHSLCISIT